HQTREIANYHRFYQNTYLDPRRKRADLRWSLSGCRERGDPRAVSLAGEVTTHHHGRGPVRVRNSLKGQEGRPSWPSALALGMGPSFLTTPRSTSPRQSP